MKTTKYYTKTTLVGLLFLAVTWSSCKKDGNPNNLPDVSPEDYVGKVDGYSSSDEIFADNLVAYWNFDGTKNEALSGTAPSSSANDAIVDGGVKGQALSLNAGWVYYGTQFPAFRTDALQSFTVSQWVQVLNNGSKKTMIFQLARPGIFNGNIDFVLETNARPATDLDNLTIHAYYTAENGGRQDNLNASWLSSYKTPKLGADKWTHLVMTYSRQSGVLQIWADGVKVGAPDYQNRGTNYFRAFEPSEVIIGGNYNSIPGKEVNTDASFAPMTGKVDEVRVYNIALPDAHIRALYNLGMANK